jgi:hypothetical protein
VACVLEQDDSAITFTLLFPVFVVLAPPYLRSGGCFLEPVVPQAPIAGKVVYFLLADLGQLVVSPCAFSAPVSDSVCTEPVPSATVLSSSGLATSSISGILPEGPVDG